MHLHCTCNCINTIRLFLKNNLFFLSNGRILKIKFFKCETKIDSRWWQVFVLMSKSLNHSFNQSIPSKPVDSLRNKCCDNYDMAWMYLKQVTSCIWNIILPYYIVGKKQNVKEMYIRIHSIHRRLGIPPTQMTYLFHRDSNVHIQWTL